MSSTTIQAPWVNLVTAITQHHEPGGGGADRVETTAPPPARARAAGASAAPCSACESVKEMKTPTA